LQGALPDADVAAETFLTWWCTWSREYSRHNGAPTQSERIDGRVGE